MRAFAIGIVLALAPTSAFAVNMKLCLQSETRYQDSGLAGEDFWTTTAATAVWRALRGNWVTIHTPGNPNPRWEGNLGDGFEAGDYGAGCTDWFWVPIANATYSISVDSEGVVNSWHLSVMNRQTEAPASHPFTFTHTGGAGQFSLQMTGITNSGDSNDDWDLFNTYQAAAWSLYRHGSGMECAQTLEIMIGTVPAAGEDDCSGGPCSANHAGYTGGTKLCPQVGQIGRIILGNGFQDHKFQVSHEIGHALFYRFTGEDSNNCGFLDPPVTGYPSGIFDDYRCGIDTTGKSWHTIEYASCAQYEGFASFYAADVWNDHGEEDCYYTTYNGGPDIDGAGGLPRLGSPLVNCAWETPDPDPNPGTLMPNAYMETYCGGTTQQMKGKGVIVDWVRVYWNVHTRNGGVNFWAMMNWMENADDWGTTTAWDELDDSAAAYGQQLDVNWLDANDDHGINHPGL